VAVDLLGYALGGAFAVVLLTCAARERRWWSWLQVAGIAVLTVAAVGGGDLPEPAERAARFAGPGLLVLGLLAWRLHWDAGWFGGDDLRPPGGPASRAAAAPEEPSPAPAGTEPEDPS
jgi:hypothetical protein